MRQAITSTMKGFSGVWENKFLVGILYLFKIVFSLALLLPLYMMFSASFARNAKASNLLTWFDPSLLVDFVYHWRQALFVYLIMFILSCGLGLLVFIFLSGGFWGVLRDRVKNQGLNSRMERFFGYCGKYFWGMFKIFLFLLVLYLIAFFVFVIFSLIFDSAAGKANLWDLSSWKVLSRLAVGLILFFWVNMIGDYLKIFFVENFGQGFIRVIRKTFKFLLTNKLGVLSLYYFLSAILAVAIFMYLGLDKAMKAMPQTGFSIFLLFLIQQLLVVFVSFFRLVFYSSQLDLYYRISKEEF